MAVRVELVREAPPIVVEAEPISVQADPDTIQQLQRRIRELEEQVKKVKQNYKSAKKAEKNLDNMIINISHFLKDSCGMIGKKPLREGELLTPEWLNDFKHEIRALKQKAGHYDTWQKSIAEHDEFGAVALEDIAKKIEKVNDLQEQLDSMRNRRDCLRKSCDDYKEKYQKAINGTLLSFQETEIQDLKEENDKLMKLNKSLLSIKKKDKLDSETAQNIINDMAEDFVKVINKLGSRKVCLDGINTTTAEVIKKFLAVNGDAMDMECLVGGEGRYKIEGTGLWRNVKDTKKGYVLKLNTKTKKIYDIDDWEAGDRSDPLGEMITGDNGQLAIDWVLNPWSSDDE